MYVCMDMYVYMCVYVCSYACMCDLPGPVAAVHSKAHRTYQH
jgi:hypothetical protein